MRGYIAGQPAPTKVIFDHLQPAGTERADRAAALGEPWFSYFAPTTSRHACALSASPPIEDHSAAELIDGDLDGSAEFGSEAPDALRASRILRATR